MLYKFRTMTNAKDKDGKLLLDEHRLTKFGKWLRSTSMDELPSLICVLQGKMSICGPRPLLVRDMVFMSEKQRKRHSVRPGITGLAQINGRNDISWEEKLSLDLVYIQRITFLNDWKIIFKTFIKVFKKEGITEQGKATADDLGDYYLKTGYITQAMYDFCQHEANKLLG